MADTGAQVTVVPILLLHHLGIEESSIFPIATAIKAVKPVPAIYLSKEACIDFGTIPENFPQIGAYLATRATEDVAAMETDDDTAVHCAVYGLPKCSNSGVVRPGDTPYGWPSRSPPPSDTPVLPCKPTQENLPHLKQWILERYKDSAFNCCESFLLSTRIKISSH